MRVRFKRSARRQNGSAAPSPVRDDTVDPTVVPADTVPECRVWVGPDSRGLELEIVAIKEAKNLLVISVLPHRYRGREP